MIGGLAGYPFAGQTAMTAFAHHVPDEGTALFVYGPHIGITHSGTLGSMHRFGQHRETKSCGALANTLARIARAEDGLPESPAWDDDDYQQRFLDRAVLPFKSRILAAESPVRQITEVAYSVIHRQVQRLLVQTRDSFHCVRIAYVGEVLINTVPRRRTGFTRPRSD